MLTSGEILEMRETLELTLPGTAILQTATRTTDGQGGQVWAYAASGTVAARLSPEGQLRGEEPQLAGRVGEVANLILTIPAETQITASDRVVYDGEAFEVVEVRDRTPWELSRRVRVVRVA